MFEIKKFITTTFSYLLNNFIDFIDQGFQKVFSNGLLKQDYSKNYR